MKRRCHFINANKDDGCIMKKQKSVYLITAFILLSVVAIAFCVFKLNNSDIDFLFEFEAYHHIQYNGVDYYHVKEDPQITTPEKVKKVTIYLVDKKLNVRYKHPYSAYAYEQDPECVYLSFNRAIFTRDKSLAKK